VSFSKAFAAATDRPASCRPYEEVNMTNILALGYPESITIAKSQARRLAKALEPHHALSHSQALEAVAKMHGDRSWGAMNTRLTSKSSETDYDLGYRYVPPDKPVQERIWTGWSMAELERLIGVLRTHPRVAPSENYRTRLDKIIADGCVSVGSIDDIFDAISAAIGDFAFAMHGRLVELFRIETQSYLHRPDEGATGTIGFQSLDIAAAASLMIKLEWIGLDTHPERLVDAVNRATKGRPYVTRHQIDCLWYRTEKEGAGRQCLVAANAFWEDTDAEDERFVTATGHRCTVFKNERGEVEVLLVDPPAH
jgi:hypothetical protein